MVRQAETRSGGMWRTPEAGVGSRRRVVESQDPKSAWMEGMGEAKREEAQRLFGMWERSEASHRRIESKTCRLETCGRLAGIEIRYVRESCDEVVRVRLIAAQMQLFELELRGRAKGASSFVEPDALDVLAGRLGTRWSREELVTFLVHLGELQAGEDRLAQAFLKHMKPWWSSGFK